MRAERKKFPIYSQIKRGKLGYDIFFLTFAVLGGFLLPAFFIRDFQKRRAMIIANRIAPPEVIARLDEDSPISIDDVSVHTIHYYNPDRVKEDRERVRRQKELRDL